MTWLGAGFSYGDLRPLLIGSSRPPPRITVLRYDADRLAMVRSMTRDSAIAAIAEHLCKPRVDCTMQRRYA